MAISMPSYKPDVALISDDLYCVMTETDTLGYIHKVGNVYVALRGSAFNHAVEVGQSLSWDTALEKVLADR